MLQLILLRNGPPVLLWESISWMWNWRTFHYDVLQACAAESWKTVWSFACAALLWDVLIFPVVHLSIWFTGCRALLSICLDFIRSCFMTLVFIKNTSIKNKEAINSGCRPIWWKEKKRRPFMWILFEGSTKEFCWNNEALSVTTTTTTRRMLC